MERYVFHTDITSVAELKIEAYSQTYFHQMWYPRLHFLGWRNTWKYEWSVANQRQKCKRIQLQKYFNYSESLAVLKMMVKKELESKRHTAQKQNICMKLNLKYQYTYVHIRENLIQYIIKFLLSKLTPRSDHPQLVNAYWYEVMPYGHLYAPTLDTKKLPTL